MRRITALLVLLVLAALVRAAIVNRGSAGNGDVDAGPVPGSVPGSSDAVVAGGLPARVTLDEGACAEAAYLCRGLAAQPDPRVVRWPDGTPVLRVRVPAPDGVGPDQARELRRQAAAGIHAWQGRPIPIRVEGDPAAEVDVSVEWARGLSEDRLGLTTVRWRIGPDGPEMRVQAFVLATHGADGRALDPARVALTAAHEMGHALGLPHSDDRDDLMYPYNTSLRLTGRDYRAMEALYRLPAGAPLVLPP